MNYCSVCKQSHDSTGCPYNRSFYDEAMDTLTLKDAEIAALKNRVKELEAQYSDLRLLANAEVGKLEDANAKYKSALEKIAGECDMECPHCPAPIDRLCNIIENARETLRED